MPAYTRVIARRTKRGLCPVCGGETKKSNSFSQTINPYRKDLLPSTKWSEAYVIVRAKVEEEADLWQPDFRHEACKKVGHE